MGCGEDKGSQPPQEPEPFCLLHSVFCVIRPTKVAHQYNTQQLGFIHKVIMVILQKELGVEIPDGPMIEQHHLSLFEVNFHIILFSIDFSFSWHGRCLVGTSVSCSFIFIASDTVRSSTNFKLIVLKSQSLLLQLMSSPTLLVWSRNPTSLMRSMNRRRPISVP